MRKRSSQAGGRTPNPPASYYYQPPAQATLVTRKKLDEMSCDEAISYTEQLMERLRKKQAREQNYLAGRARKGIHTSTDELYEMDQQLENELLAVLAEVAEAWREKARYYAGNGSTTGII